MSYLRKIINENYKLAIQKGTFQDEAIISVSGFSTSTTTAQETIYDNGTLYQYLTTAKALDLVSTNAGDTQNITIEGLDSTDTLQSETIALNGTTIVTTTKTFNRVFKAYNSSNINLLGDVSISETGTGNILGKILYHNYSTLQA